MAELGRFWGNMQNYPVGLQNRCTTTVLTRPVIILPQPGAAREQGAAAPSPAHYTKALVVSPVMPWNVTRVPSDRDSTVLPPPTVALASAAAAPPA